MSTIFRPYQPSDAERGDRSARDRQRHRQKVRESIRDNIADIIAEESIIGRSRDRIVKVPLRGIKEYRFVYGENNPRVGQGDGGTERGQVVGQGDGRQPGSGDQAGDQPGVDYYETDITLEELIEIMFEDLELPEMERKKLREIEADRFSKSKGYRSVGIRARLDKRRTVRAKLRRQVASGRRREPPVEPENSGEEALDAAADAALDATPDAALDATTDAPAARQRFPFQRDDLTYRYVTRETRPQSNAVVLCIMDTSGSMDTLKKYLARSFFFLLYQFLNTRYRNVEVVFIAHHTTAREVSEDEFFHKGESGGTFVSSGYLKALEVIHERFHPSLWNIYAFHCSDGDNFASDAEAALRAARELSELCNLFGYGEIKPHGQSSNPSALMQVLDKLEGDNFQAVAITDKSSIWPSFKKLLAKERTP